MPYRAHDAPDGRTEITSARTMDGLKTKWHFLFGEKSPDRTPEASGHLHQISVVARLASSLRAALAWRGTPR